MTDEQIIFALHLGVCALLFGMGVPLWREKVRPNHWYGFRTPATIREERIWYPVNRVTGCWMMATGVISAPVVVATFLAGLSADEAALTNLAVILIGIVGMIVQGLTLIAKLKRELRELADASREE